MQIKIKTLTPLWTGDANGNCETLKETGIIGSLRWWYEALVRGLGRYACDPTSDKKCELMVIRKVTKNELKNYVQFVICLAVVVGREDLD